MIWRVLMVLGVAYLVGIIGIVLFRVFGPFVEVAYLPPVKALEIEETACSGLDLVVRFFLDKRAYSIAENGAELIALNVHDGGEAMAWRRAVDGDQSSFSAPAGEQVRSLVIVNGCNRDFTIRTRHVSPITNLTLPMSWVRLSHLKSRASHERLALMP